MRMENTPVFGVLYERHRIYVFSACLQVKVREVSDSATALDLARSIIDAFPAEIDTSLVQVPQIEKMCSVLLGKLGLRDASVDLGSRYPGDSVVEAADLSHLEASRCECG